MHIITYHRSVVFIPGTNEEEFSCDLTWNYCKIYWSFHRAAEVYGLRLRYGHAQWRLMQIEHKTNTKFHTFRNEMGTGKHQQHFRVGGTNHSDIG